MDAEGGEVGGGEGVGGVVGEAGVALGRGRVGCGDVSGERGPYGVVVVVVDTHGWDVLRCCLRLLGGW